MASPTVAKATEESVYSIEIIEETQEKSPSE
jgi:hypothetical protein